MPDLLPLLPSLLLLVLLPRHQATLLDVNQEETESLNFETDFGNWNATGLKLVLTNDTEEGLVEKAEGEVSSVAVPDGNMTGELWMTLGIAQNSQLEVEFSLLVTEYNDTSPDDNPDFEIRVVEESGKNETLLNLSNLLPNGSADKVGEWNSYRYSIKNSANVTLVLSLLLTPGMTSNIALDDLQVSWIPLLDTVDVLSERQEVLFTPEPEVMLTTEVPENSTESLSNTAAENSTETSNSLVNSTETADGSINSTETSNSFDNLTEASISSVNSTLTSNTTVNSTEASISSVNSTLTSNMTFNSTEASISSVNSTDTSNTTVNSIETPISSINSTDTSNTADNSTENSISSVNSTDTSNTADNSTEQNINQANTTTTTNEPSNIPENPTIATNASDSPSTNPTLSARVSSSGYTSQVVLICLVVMFGLLFLVMVVKYYRLRSHMGDYQIQAGTSRPGQANYDNPAFNGFGMQDSYRSNSR